MPNNQYFLTFEEFANESAPMSRSPIPDKSDLKAFSNPQEIGEKMSQTIKDAAEWINKALEVGNVDTHVSLSGGMPEVIIQPIENEDPRFSLIWHTNKAIGKEGLQSDWFKDIEKKVHNGMERAIKDSLPSAKIQKKLTKEREGYVEVVFDLFD